jgi:hypothetical protein
MPNPLYDISRIFFGLRGYLSIEDFFMATILGKFFVKTIGEIFFVIIMFSTGHLQMIVKAIRSVFPPRIGTYFMAWMSLNRRLLEPGNEPLKFDAFVWGWQILVTLAVLTMMVSLLQSLATAHKLNRKVKYD